MKQISKTVLKAVFIIVLFTGGSVALSTTGVETVSEANATTVGYNQVYEYLVSKGYTVVSMQPTPGEKFDWTAHTIMNGFHLMTVVHCNGNCIVGHEDVATM